MARAGPAGTWTTFTPGCSCTTSGSPRASRRVNTSTVWPRSARADGERGDVHVLPAGVVPAEHRQRARVLGHHRYLHRATSSRSRSQSARNRARPNRSSACRRATSPCARARPGSAARARAAVARASDVGGDEAGAGRHGLRRGGRREREDRHADGHRLEQGQAQAGPAVRVQVGAVLGHPLVQVGLCELLGAGEPRRHQLLDAVGLHAVHVHGDRAGDPGREVGAGDAGTAHWLVARERRGSPACRCRGGRGRGCRARRPAPARPRCPTSRR